MPSQFTPGKVLLHASALQRHSSTSEKEILWDVRGKEAGKENDSAGKEERKWGRMN